MAKEDVWNVSEFIKLIREFDIWELVKSIGKVEQDMSANLFKPTTTLYDIAYHKWILLNHELKERQGQALEIGKI